MAVFNKYDQFALDQAQGVHDLSTAGSTLRIALTNTAPNAATHETLSDINEIPYTNIIEPMPADVQNTGSENPPGTWEVVAVDITLNASGPVATFRYVVLYNDTPTSPADPLMGWWDYGSAVTLDAGESFTVDFAANLLTIT